MVRKTKAEAQETRHQILDAAEHIFLRQGVARTSLQEIAEAAGVTRGAVYWHFENKPALFRAMLDRVILPCEGALQEMQAAAAEDLPDALARLAMTPLENLATKPQVQRVFTVLMHFTEFTGEMASERDKHRTMVAGYMAQMEALLARGQAAGAFGTQLAPRSAALGLFAVIDGLMYHWTLSPSSFDLTEVGQQIIRNFVDSIRGR